MGAPLYFSHPASFGHIVTGLHPERPARIKTIEQELGRRAFLGYERRPAPEATHEALGAVHAEAYVERVRSMAERGAVSSTPPRDGGGPWVLAGGACALVEALLAGGADVGFCATRPLGRHAALETTSGFCLFNNVAVAARHALDSLGASRVFIVDWDVHHGNGTNDVFRSTDAVLFASIHQGGNFPGTGPLHDVGAPEERASRSICARRRPGNPSRSPRIS